MDIVYIILFIFLIRKTGALAAQKGLKRSTWQWYMAGAWILTGSIGSAFTMNYLGIVIQPAKSFRDSMNNMWNLPDRDLLILSFGTLFFAFGGYLLIRAILEKKPDFIEEDVDSIKSDDLKPPSAR